MTHDPRDDAGTAHDRSWAGACVVAGAVLFILALPLLLLGVVGARLNYQFVATGMVMGGLGLAILGYGTALDNQP